MSFNRDKVRKIASGAVRPLMVGCALALLLFTNAVAQNAQPLAQRPMPANARPPVLKDIGIDQLLNNDVPLDLTFRNEAGQTVKLGDYFNAGKPVVISLVYYDCPQLCTMTLTGLLGALKTLPLLVGKDFTSVTVSFDPREKPELAAAKKAEYVKRLNTPDVEKGWHFLTGDEPQIQALARAVGFRYVWDPVTKQYGHSSGIMILTPEGKVSRYLFGIEYAPRDLRFALIDASKGRVGTLADQMILYCYMYDPERGTYGLVMSRLLKVFGSMTIVSLGTLIFYLRRKEKQIAAERREVTR